MAVRIVRQLSVAKTSSFSALLRLDLSISALMQSFEIASFVYDYNGEPARSAAQSLEN